MKKFCLLVYLVVLDATPLHSEKVDPLSKIIIKSKSLKFENKSSDESTIQYRGNVNVLLADKTTINSDFLEILMKKSLILGGDKNDAEDNSEIKRIIFEGNVLIDSENRSAKASKAELLLEEKKVILRENIEISQQKEKPKDLPLTIKANEVVIDLNEDDAHIMGSEEKPIETTIELAGYPGLLKRIKTPEEKARIRREKRKAEREARKKNNLKNNLDK